MGSTKPSTYEILLKPIVTEKSAQLGTSTNQVVTFIVHPKATKNEIARAVEKGFNVKVEAVRTMNVLGKVKRGKFGFGRMQTRKKAYITLGENQQIDMLEGL
jgi:large subunit ribosomal protein L23